MPALSLLLRFLLSAVIGAAGAFGVAAVLTPGVSSQARPGPAQSIELTGEAGDPLAFGLVAIPDAQPVALEALPDDKTLQLVAFVEPGTTPTDPFRPAWVNALGYPRIPPISQFDGGPLANKNCVMASGAMLARLTYGIVTTGTQMRSLSGDPSGGTGPADLQRALNKGWGVQFQAGLISALQLRSLLYAGAGAVILGRYGEIPANLSFQPSFKDGHAIYLDGFRPAGPDGDAAYYVIDPLSRADEGVWWPANIVERFGRVFGGGRIITLWGFPGGGRPAHYPPLPPSAWPEEDQPSQEPGAPTPSPPPLPEPGDLPPLEVSPGDVPPIEPIGPGIHFDWPVKTGIFRIDPSFLLCIGPGAPPGCPDGLLAVFPKLVTPPPQPLFPILGEVKLLFADSVQPGVLRVIFTIPEGSQGGLQYWPSDGSGGRLLAPSAIEAMVLDGQVVQVASIPVEAGLGYNFVAMAAADGGRALSAIGTVGQ